MSIYGVLFACIIGIPIGILISRYTKLSWPIITIANIIQTVPAIAMLAILMLGLGPNTVVFAVFLYALLQLLRIRTLALQVDYNIKDAGKGMGMTKNQVMRMIELPLSLSVIIGGIRIALVVAIGIVAIGSFIGASTLGDILYEVQTLLMVRFIYLRCHSIALIAIIIIFGITFIRNDPTNNSKKQRQ